MGINFELYRYLKDYHEDVVLHSYLASIETWRDLILF